MRGREVGGKASESVSSPKIWINGTVDFELSLYSRDFFLSVLSTGSSLLVLMPKPSMS